MKIKFYILSLIAVLAMMVSCTEKFEPTTLGEIKVSTSYVSIPVEGGSAKMELTTTGDYTIEGMPEWLTVSPTSGAAGTSTITFSAEATVDGRTSNAIRIKVGEAEQIINVIQGLSTVAEATCAEVIAGPDAKTYRTKGVVTAIANTTYGNFYINDGTGEVYIYGTLYQGKTQNNPIANNNIEVGDEVTVEGPKKTYNGTIELIDVTVVNVAKSLLKIDSLSVATLPKEGGEFTAFITNKAEGLNVESPVEWLTIKSIKTTGINSEVTFKVEPNEGAARDTEITFVTSKSGKTYTASTAITQEGAIEDLTCAQFNAKEDGSAQYKVHGIITKIASDVYGNIYINDGTGEVYVYGVLDAEGNTKNFASLGLKVGDEVTLQSVKTSYKNAPQMKNAVVVSSVAHDVKTIAELQSLADDKNTYYLVTGTVFHLEGDAYKYDLTTYGNFGLKDETGEIYVYGVADALDGVTKNFAATGIQEGDNITILAYKTSYKGNNQIVGKFIKNNTEK